MSPNTPSCIWSGLVVLLAFGLAKAEAASLSHDVYVWQRAWTPAVQAAAAEHGAAFRSMVILRAEVTWKGEKPQLAQVPIDYHSLTKIKRPIGLALRIGPYSGSFAAAAPAIYLADLSGKIVTDAKTGGLDPSELQLDFDCAASKLDGYRDWVEIITKRIYPTRLVITALPAWLDRMEFRSLAQAAGSYVLQVHSLERPGNINAPFTLCDPTFARRSVQKAAALGVTFRVALPTYGYVMAFDASGAFLGLSAEGPQKNWPPDARLREIRSDPLEIARLVQEWSVGPAGPLQGVIWYRLPVETDTLNWRWPTLSAMVEARLPRKSVRVKAHRVEPGLTQISLVNDGEIDISSRLAVQTRWHGARLLAGDGLRGFELADQALSSARLQTTAHPWRLPAGDEQVIGWLRLNEDREVELELQEF